MAHFAEIDVLKRVLSVHVIENKDMEDKDGNEVESIGAAYLHNIHGSTWIQTSYNTIAGQHTLGGTPFRKNYAGVGYTYDETRDAFIPPKPFPSWTLNESTCQWDPPVLRTKETDWDKSYEWNEAEQRWDLKDS